MDDDSSDREEIDLLIRELMTRRREQRKALPVFGQPVLSRPAERRPASRWSTVTMLMPSRPAAGFGSRFTFASAISLPQMPDLSRVLRLPRPVTIVRMWVGLGAAHSAAMTFWPYPKTYLWGLVLYLLALGLGLLAGIWGARLSWDERLGSAHTVALGASLWAVALGVAETLPLL